MTRLLAAVVEALRGLGAVRVRRVTDPAEVARFFEETRR